MSNVVDLVEKPYLRTDLPPIEIGDTVRVHTRIVEADNKERIQIFEGVVIRWRKGGVRSTVTVRKVSHGVGVERVFPVHGPSVAKFEIKARGEVRRARLYYLRNLEGKAARIKARTVESEDSGEGQASGGKGKKS